MITSADNQQIKRIRALLEKPSQRRKSSLFVAEGVRMFLETPTRLIETVYASSEFMTKSVHASKVKKLPHEVVEDGVFKKISDTYTPQGVLMVLKMPVYGEEYLAGAYGSGLFLILNRIQDPGNLGTLIRTAEAAGATGVIMDRECADLFNPKVIRSTMGSVYRVPFIITDELGPYLDRMKSGGVRLVAGDLDGEVFYDMSKAFDREKSEGLPQGGAGIMIGNEGAGLLPEILQRADVRLRIPMEGKVSSLNAAVSGALLMYEAARLMRKD